MTAPPPRLHVVMRPETDRAVVLRQGPSTTFCALGWDLARDAVEVGQWCRHKIYPERCDVSSDGRWWTYFALDGKWSSPARGSFTVLARWPYLKAVRLWPQGDTWGGGGQIFATRAQLPAAVAARWADLDRIPGSRDRLWLTHDATRLRFRDGWTAIGPSAAGALERMLDGGWRLRRTLAGRLPPYTLVAPDGHVESRPTWTWAEHDVRRRRLLWAAEGALWAAPLTPRGPGAAAVVFDANGMRFAATPAPYADEPEIVTR